jgi:thiol:disulfide interchange protein
MKIRFIVILTFFWFLAHAEEVYDPSVDAMSEIIKAISIAKESNKHVFVKVGGNWCGWCKLYDKFSNSDEDIALIMRQEYITVLANWSPENRNLEAMNYLGRPQRFGYPVFIIIDGNGNVLHTQDTALLEEGRGYNKNHVLRFLKVWTYSAVSAKIKE